MAPGEVEFIVENNAVGTIAFDRNAVETVLLNLLVNAHKYTGVDKRVTLRSVDEPDAVLLEVEDNGIGIPKSEQNKIFEPFYRSDERLRSQAAGAGLGLAIVRALVTAHGGTIEAWDGSETGTVMVVRLPATGETS